MPTDKQLLIDLSALTPESTAKLASIKDDMIAELEKAGKRTKPQAKKRITDFEKEDLKFEKKIAKLQKQMEFEAISQKGKKGIASKIFGSNASLKNVIQMGLNPQSFFGGVLSKGIPGFGIAVAATAIVISILKKFDALEKKFTDQINTKLRVDRNNENTARIQAGLDQEITTVSPGIYDPRDAYNTFNEFNTNRARIETDYAIRNTLAVE